MDDDPLPLSLGDRRAMAVEWALPEDIQWYVAGPWPTEWLEGLPPGFIYECIGLPRDPEDGSEYPPTLTTPSGHEFTAYRVRAYRRGSPLYFEKVFYPGKQIPITLHG